MRIAFVIGLVGTCGMIDHRRKIMEPATMGKVLVAARIENLSDLFKPAIQLSDPSLGPDETFRFTVSGVAPGKTNYFQFSSDVSGANPGRDRRFGRRDARAPGHQRVPGPRDHPPLAASAALQGGASNGETPPYRA